MRPTTSIRQILGFKPSGQDVVVQGWLRTVRHSKTVSFLEISDGSCFAGIQAVVDHAQTDPQALQKFTTGCAVKVMGRLQASLGGKQNCEIQAVQVELIGGVDEDYPLQKKNHSFEFLRTIAHLRPRTNTFGAVFRVRNALSRAAHEFFQARGFLYLHTPIITASDCEGAGEMFRVTTLAPGQFAQGAVDFTQDFFGTEAHLTVSGQMQAEIAALALANVYTFGPTFRAENSHTTRHLAEFWMIEPEMAFCDLEGDMDVAEAFLKHLLRAVLQDCPDDMAFFQQRIEPSLLSTLENVIESPFERIDYGEAIAILEKSGARFEFPVTWGMDLQSEHERYLTETHAGRPVIVTNYPKQVKAFYMHLNTDGKTVAAMDVLVPKVGEIIGGSQREARLDVLRARLREQNLAEEKYWWYLDLRRYGSVPHAGFGLGLERLVQFVTGMANIRDVIPFPRVPGSADF